MNSITHSQLIAYMKNLVDQFNEIDVANFFRMDISEIQGAMRTGVSYPAFAYESHEGNFEGSKSTNSLDNKTFAFTILKKPQLGNFDQQNEYLDDCEIIGKKFLSRMRFDSSKSTSILYGIFDAALVSYHKVGPLYVDHCYGYRFEVALKPDKANLKVEADDWADIDSVC